MEKRNRVKKRQNRRCCTLRGICFLFDEIRLAIESKEKNVLILCSIPRKIIQLSRSATIVLDDGHWCSVRDPRETLFFFFLILSFLNCTPVYLQ